MNGIQQASTCFVQKHHQLRQVIEFIFYRFVLKGPIAAPLGRRFGTRACVMVGGLMMGVAFVVASFSSVLALAVVLAVLAGGCHYVNATDVFGELSSG